MSSWLSGLASKTEDILNKMDHAAANVLSTSESKIVGRSNVSSDYRENENYHQIDIDGSSTIYQQRPQPQYISPGNQNTVQGSQRSAPHSRSSSISSSFSTISAREVVNNSNYTKPSNTKAVDDDEKLFEFLNSKGSSVASTQGSDSPKTDVTSEEKQWSEVENPDVETSSDKLETIVEVKRETSDQVIKLKDQVKSLTREITQLTKRNVDLETDCKRLQKRLDNWQSQIVSSDNALRELQSRESDLKTTVDVKDSQLAVLRVRLEECDDKLKEKANIIKRLEEENETLLKEREDNLSNFDENLISLRHRIKELEESLLNEKEIRLQAQQETMNTIGNYQESQRQLSEEIANLQRQCALERNMAKELEKQFHALQTNHEALENEFSEYRIKAQRTLQSKDDLIKALQNDGTFKENEDTNQVNILLQSECDSLLLEVQDLRNKNDALTKELDTIWKTQITSLNERISQLSAALEEEQDSKNDLKNEVIRLQEELKDSDEDHERIKNNLQARIQDRDIEIEKLRKQLVSKRSSAPGASSYDELETRIKNLTENLIQKQTYVEQLSSERHSLALQLERTESRLRESLDVISSNKNMNNIPGAVTIGMMHSSPASNLVNRIRPLVEESPYDGQVTRRVKRAYDHIDGFSLRLGLILRHHPSARAFVIFYILLLHIWVIFILFNYRPKITEP